MRILKIHASGISKHGEIDYEKVVKLSEVRHTLHVLCVCVKQNKTELCVEYFSFAGIQWSRYA